MVAALLAVVLGTSPSPPTADRLRGAMVHPAVTAADLAILGRDWKANVIRYQLTWESFPRSPADNATLDQYRAWLDGTLPTLDRTLRDAKAAGLWVIVDLHTPPGGRDEYFDCRLFAREELAKEFLDIWDRLATRYRGNPAVWAFDLLNEPAPGKAGASAWNTLAIEAIRRIRRVDPKRRIVFEPAPWAAPKAFGDLKPLPFDHVIYSPHVYEPQEFTHQGVFGKPTGIPYPGRVAGGMWDRERLRKELAPVRAFQRTHRARIYVGEFSAIRWAPDRGAHRYLADAISLFEEYGWDWTYHAFREWDGWSVEHSEALGDSAPSAKPTDRQNLLQRLFRRNQTRPGN